MKSTWTWFHEFCWSDFRSESDFFLIVFKHKKYWTNIKSFYPVILKKEEKKQQILKAQRAAMKTPGWLTYATGAGAIITGLGCKLMLVVCTLMTVVGAWLRCFNSRCIWHQEHQMQKQETPMSLQREPCGETKRKMFKVLNLTAFRIYSTWNSALH